MWRGSCVEEIYKDELLNAFDVWQVDCSKAGQIVKGNEHAGEYRCWQSKNWEGIRMSSVRKNFLVCLFSLVAMAGFGAYAEDTVKIGILHSLSGTMAISETSLKDVVLMAVDEINSAGGIMGKKIEPVIVDPA